MTIIRRVQKIFKTLIRMNTRILDLTHKKQYNKSDEITIFVFNDNDQLIHEAPFKKRKKLQLY